MNTDLPRDLVLPKDNTRDPTIRGNTHYSYKKLYNCDVCWTCGIFNINNFKCEYYNACGFALNRFDKEYYDENRSIAIKNPEFFRCTFWEDDHYWRTK